MGKGLHCGNGEGWVEEGGRGRERLWFGHSSELRSHKATARIVFQYLHSLSVFRLPLLVRVICRAGSKKQAGGGKVSGPEGRVGKNRHRCVISTSVQDFLKFCVTRMAEKL